MEIALDVDLHIFQIEAPDMGAQKPLQSVVNAGGVFASRRSVASQ